jgi:hypothetical protein
VLGGVGAGIFLRVRLRRMKNNSLTNHFSVEFGFTGYPEGTPGIGMLASHTTAVLP